MEKSVYLNGTAFGRSALEAPAEVLGWDRVTTFVQAAWRLACEASRGAVRLAGLALVLPLALGHAVVVRVTSNPASGARARGRARWFHCWSAVVCRVLGLQVERRGFLPASGLVVVDRLNELEALLLAAVTPAVFVADMGVRGRPALGWLARYAGTIFHDAQRRNDVERINFMIERALKRRQLVAVSRTCPSLRWLANSQISLTACAIRGDVTTRLLTQADARVAVAFHPPVYHAGNRQQVAGQIRSELQALQSAAA